MDRVKAFFITTSAQLILGRDALGQAFNWQVKFPTLQRLRIGDPDPQVLEAWCQLCDDWHVEPVLALGPDDVTPDLEVHPMLSCLELLTIHALNTPDMDAAKLMIAEPDAVFTNAWESYSAGHRDWFAPPGPIGVLGEQFFSAYATALAAYQGTILGQPRQEFEMLVAKAWTKPLEIEDVVRTKRANGNVGFALRRFPFCTMYVDDHNTWRSEGWLPSDLQSVDPDNFIANQTLRTVDDFENPVRLVDTVVNWVSGAMKTVTELVSKVSDEARSAASNYDFFKQVAFAAGPGIGNFTEGMTESGYKFKRKGSKLFVTCPASIALKELKDKGVAVFVNGTRFQLTYDGKNPAKFNGRSRTMTADYPACEPDFLTTAATNRNSCRFELTTPFSESD